MRRESVGRTGDRVKPEPCSSFFVSGWIFVVFTDRTYKHYNNKHSILRHSVKSKTPHREARGAMGGQK